MAGPARGRRRAGGEERRTEIVRAAFEMIGERGYRGTSLAAVAERIGLTQQGVMHYFPTKAHLLAAVLDARDQWDTAALASDGAVWPPENLVQLVEYNAARPGVIQTFTALVGESVAEEHPARPFFEERYRTVRARMAESVRQAYGDRLPGGLTPERAARLLVAVMDGLQIQWLLASDEIDMAGSFRDFLALLGAGPDGAGAPGRRPAPGTAAAAPQAAPLPDRPARPEGGAPG